MYDQRTGYGKMIYQDGAEFPGYWLNGKFSEPVTTERPLTTTTAPLPPDTTTTGSGLTEHLLEAS